MKKILAPIVGAALLVTSLTACADFKAGMEAAASEAASAEAKVEPAKVPVPNVVEMRTAQAQAALDAAGFKYTLKNSDKSTVESQNPAAGEMLTAGKAVVLTLGMSAEEKLADATAKAAAARAAADAKAAAAQAAADAKAAAAQAAADAEAARIAALGTVSQQNATRKAEHYLSHTAFSHDGLVGQLEFEGFPNADAVWGVDHVTVDWNEQAALKAAHYLSHTAFSHDGLVDQLVFEKFTPEQAEYGVSTTGL
ncbi:Ltp family lipoprotein [Cellulomonas sp. URHB0016]